MDDRETLEQEVMGDVYGMERFPDCMLDEWKAPKQESPLLIKQPQEQQEHQCQEHHYYQQQGQPRRKPRGMAVWRCTHVCTEFKRKRKRDKGTIRNNTYVYLCVCMYVCA